MSVNKHEKALRNLGGKGPKSFGFSLEEAVDLPLEMKMSGENKWQVVKTSGENKQ